MACGATLKRRHDCITEAPELPLKRRRFVPSQDVMAPSSPTSSPPPTRGSCSSSCSSSSVFPSLISHMTTEQLSSSIMSELSRTRRRSEDEPTISNRQLQQTCARLLLQFESQIRAEYDKIMSEKLIEQYESFTKYTQDHLRNNKPHSMSYVS